MEVDELASGNNDLFDATAIELATGLSLADVEILGAHPSPEVRADIAVKFAREFDRLSKDSSNRLATEFLKIFSKDRTKLVRMCFAESIKNSVSLPLDVAQYLAKDDIDVAAPILRESPVLSETIIGDIIKTMPEDYSLTIADRKPLSRLLTALMIEHKGTKRVAMRLLDNDKADFSEDALLSFHEWGRIEPDIATRLRRRPNLPFSFVNQNVVELTDKLQWRSLGERTMSKYEASQLQDRFEGRTGQRYLSGGTRFRRMEQALREDFERGHLDPPQLLAFLRDRNVDHLECALAIMTGLDLQKVRGLLHGSDRRGLIALCLKADFSCADYLAFRMALGLAEIGTLREEQEQKYSETTMIFACDQFEKMRANPNQLKRWLPQDPAS